MNIITTFKKVNSLEFVKTQIDILERIVKTFKLITGIDSKLKLKSISKTNINLLKEYRNKLVLIHSYWYDVYYSNKDLDFYIL